MSARYKELLESLQRSHEMANAAKQASLDVIIAKTNKALKWAQQLQTQVLQKKNDEIIAEKKKKNEKSLLEFLTPDGLFGKPSSKSEAKEEKKK